MGFFSFLHKPDINQGLEAYLTTPGSVLLDVRSPQEYHQGHIPGSRNVPLQTLDKVAETVENKEAPLFVYCLSGGRSRQAVETLKSWGYSNVKNLGGIASYTGKVER